MSVVTITGDKELSQLIASNAQRFEQNPKLLHVITYGIMQKAKANARSHAGRTWAEIANATHITKDTQFASVIECFHVAGRQRHFGGSIRARNKACLTIPVDKAAYRKTVADFSGLIRVGNRLGQIRSGSFFPLFALCKVTKPQRATPWWPTDTEAIAVAYPILQRVSLKDSSNA